MRSYTRKSETSFIGASLRPVSNACYGNIPVGTKSESLLFMSCCVAAELQELSRNSHMPFYLSLLFEFCSQDIQNVELDSEARYFCWFWG